MLTWQGGAGPWYISALPGGQPSAAPLASIGQFSTQSTTWVVNLAAGTAVSLSITDSTGVTNYAAQLTVGAGSTTCMNGGAAAAAASPAAATPAAQAPVAAAPAAADPTTSSVTKGNRRTKGQKSGTAVAAAAQTTSVLPAALAATATTTLNPAPPLVTASTPNVVIMSVTSTSSLPSASATTHNSAPANHVAQAGSLVAVLLSMMALVA